MPGRALGLVGNPDWVGRWKGDGGGGWADGAGTVRGGTVGWWAETPSASPRLGDGREERKGRARQHSRAPALPWSPHGFL